MSKNIKMEFPKDTRLSVWMDHFMFIVVYNWAVWRKRADSNLPPFFRHGFVTVVPWETLAGEQAGESVLPRSKI